MTDYHDEFIVNNDIVWHIYELEKKPLQTV